MNYHTSTSTKFFIRRTPVYAATLSALALTFQLSCMPVLGADATTTTTTDPTTTTTTTDPIIAISPSIAMENVTEGLLIEITGINPNRIIRLFFDGVDVTELVNQMESAGIVKSTEESERSSLLVQINEPFLGEHSFGIETIDGVLISKKFTLQQPNTEKAKTATAKYLFRASLSLCEKNTAWFGSKCDMKKGYVKAVNEVTLENNYGVDMKKTSTPAYSNLNATGSTNIEYAVYGDSTLNPINSPAYSYFSGNMVFLIKEPTFVDKRTDTGVTYSCYIKPSSWKKFETKNSKGIVIQTVYQYIGGIIYLKDNCSF